jgi:hypothetical protein
LYKSYPVDNVTALRNNVFLRQETMGSESHFQSTDGLPVPHPKAKAAKAPTMTSHRYCSIPGKADMVPTLQGKRVKLSATKKKVG